MNTPIAILLVDDEPRNLQVLTTILDSPDYELVEASSADEALMALMQKDFAAIVLDVRMPDLDGIELAKLIKQRRKTQHIPIVFLTAYDLGEDQVVLGYGAGAVDYITKPVNPAILRSKIGVFIELFKKTRALAEVNLAMATEIEERQKAEERFRLLVESSPNAIIVFDRDNLITLVNSRTETLFGYERPELLAMPMETVIPDGLDISRLDGSHSSAPPPHVSGEFFGRRKDGSRVPLEINFSRIEPADGTFFLASMLDITKRKKAEAALHEANAELLQQANDRARRIQAEAAQAEAEAANRAKDHFLAMLSHELRTPLSPVLNAVTLLQEEGGGSESMRESLATIRRNVQLEARLIDDLLDLAKIRNGKLQLHTEPVDVHDLLHRALDICQPDISANGLGITLNLHAADSRLNADPARIQQIFWNLISNAIKYTPRGGQLTLATSNTGGMVQFDISDSGIGIEPEKIREIFNAFTQVHDTHSHGLGLGLAICRALTELHGGAIEARSDGITRGATFSVKLPVVCQPVAKSSPAAVESPAEQFPLRLLLVEDHGDTIQSFAKLLVRRGYQLRMATNVAEAVRVAGEYEFDVLISDIGLPDGSGLDLMRQFLASKGDRIIHGIALSGFGMQEDLDRSREAGFSCHFIKPVDIAQVYTALNRIGREGGGQGRNGGHITEAALPKA